MSCLKDRAASGGCFDFLTPREKRALLDIRPGDTVMQRVPGIRIPGSAESPSRGLLVQFISQVRKNLERNRNVVDPKFAELISAIIDQTVRYDFEAAAGLLNYGVPTFSDPDRVYLYPIHLAAAIGNVPIIDALLHNGANSNLLANDVLSIQLAIRFRRDSAVIRMAKHMNIELIQEKNIPVMLSAAKRCLGQQAINALIGAGVKSDETSPDEIDRYREFCMSQLA
jgi:hypothetical protein